MKQRPRFQPIKPDFLPFDGGLDLETPPLRVPPGTARQSQNFECSVNGGYSTVAGYERYDGRPKPSDATYSILNAVITGSYAIGDTLTGGTSAATGVIIAADSDYFVLTKVTGTFQDGEDLEVSAVAIATADGTQIEGNASSALLDAQYLNLAADEYRSDIAAIPGSGPVRGIVSFGGVRYGFRDNVGATACVMHKSTSGGWSAVALGRELAFTSGGSTVINEGDTITGAISGATAVITRVALESGSWSGGTAAGRLIFASQTGNFVAEDLNVGASLNVATIAGNSSAITLLPGGRFEFVAHNFGNSANAKRLYGVDGVNRGFEFDGTVFVPIRTGYSADSPDHVYVHKKHLFYSFGGSVQHSSTGTPYMWTIVSGAAEIAPGDDVTGFVGLMGSQDGGGALVIFMRNATAVLYGSSTADWNLVTYSDEAGAKEWTAQRVGAPVLMLDDRGVSTLQATSSFGNFSNATLTQRIQRWINTRRSLVNASCVVRDKNQYRLFFTDRYALYVTMNGNKVKGLMPVLLGHAVECIWSGEGSDGAEEIYFGASNGMVYQMEKGTSFDGDDIEFFIDVAFFHGGSPRTNKRYRHMSFEVTGVGYAGFNASYQLGYNTVNRGQPAGQSVTVELSSSEWDVFTWDAFFWDGQSLTPTELKMDGTAENVSLRLYGLSDYYTPVTFSGAILHSTARRTMRGN